jgi:hypothetical protein
MALEKPSFIEGQNIPESLKKQGITKIYPQENLGIKERLSDTAKRFDYLGSNLKIKVLEKPTTDGVKIFFSLIIGKVIALASLETDKNWFNLPKLKSVCLNFLLKEASIKLESKMGRKVLARQVEVMHPEYAVTFGEMTRSFQAASALTDASPKDPDTSFTNIKRNSDGREILDDSLLTNNSRLPVHDKSNSVLEEKQILAEVKANLPSEFRLAGYSLEPHSTEYNLWSGLIALTDMKQPKIIKCLFDSDGVLKGYIDVRNKPQKFANMSYQAKYNKIKSMLAETV